MFVPEKYINTTKFTLNLDGDAILFPKMKNLALRDFRSTFEALGFCTISYFLMNRSNL